MLPLCYKYSGRYPISRYCLCHVLDSSTWIAHERDRSWVDLTWATCAVLCCAVCGLRGVWRGRYGILCSTITLFILFLVAVKGAATFAQVRARMAY